MNQRRNRRAWPTLPLPRAVRRSLRKWTSGWLALLLVLQTWIPIATAADLTDTQGHWAEAEIEGLVDEGIVKGYQDGSFRPDAPITRAEFVTLLNRAAGAEPAGETASFADVTPRDWFANDVALAAATRTVNGFQDGTFRPQQPITRQEAAVLLARVLDLTSEAGPTFADSAAIPAWAAPGVAAVASAGFMKGYPDATFGGEKPITRAEAATLLQRTRMRMLLTMPRRVAVTVADEQGAPVSGATVRIHKQGQQAYLAGGLTGANGQIVRYLRAGEYSMTAVAGGLAGYTNEKVLPGAANVSLTVAKAATLSGVVVDGAKQPVPGALVTLTTNPTFLAVTGPDGRFTASVPGGRDYQLAVAFFEDGQTRFGQNLDAHSDYLALLDNPNAPLPNNAPRPRVTKVTPGATAPQGEGTADLGQMNGATGQRTAQPGGNPPGGNPPGGNPPGGNPPGGNPPGGNPPGGNPPGGGGNPAPTLQSLTITPAEATLGIGKTQAFTVAGTMSNNTPADTTKATFTVAPANVASISATGTVKALAEGTATITATLGTKTATATLTVVSLAGPAVDPTVAGDIATSTAFLYSGDNPIQTGVADNTIKAERVAVLRGKVTTRDGSPLAGVTITILNHAEYGQTLTRVDGMFDLAVNGGGQVTVQYDATGYLPAQRTTDLPWQDFVWLPDVTLIPVDTKVTEIDLSTPTTEVQVAQGSPVTDETGTRTATVLFMPGTTAKMVVPGGTEVSLETLSVRATEYTVGTGGPASMPGELPPTSAYTYALELSVDEARAVGATSVTFNQPVPFYVDNFRLFDVGEVVPMGYYDRAKAAWVGSENGRVIKIVSETNGMADIDTDGVGGADNDPTLGITDAERERLAELYEPGKELWRVPITHFTPWDCNWPYGPPPGANGPNNGPTPRTPSDRQCIKGGSIIECQSQILGEAVKVTGTPFTLHYQSDRTPGGSQEAYTIDIPITGSNPNKELIGVKVMVTVAGRNFRYDFGKTPNQNFTFTWDGKDAYGRQVQGEVQAKVEIGYTYRLVYYSSPRSFSVSWAIPGATPMGSRTENPTVTLWRDWTARIGAWDASAVGLGGWTISAHHAYDPTGQAVYYGNGERRHLTGVNLISTVAGNGVDDESLDLGNGKPATQAIVAYPTTVAVAADGTLYIGQNDRIRKVGPDGIITHYAGGGVTLGDDGPAVNARLGNVSGLAVGPDGSLYIADAGDNRLRRIGTDGIINTVAGTGGTLFTPDGAVASQASIYRPLAVAAAPDGTIYVAEAGHYRIRRIGTDDIITTFAGTGEPAYEGDGGAAVAAKIGSVYALALGPDGSLYLADRNYNRIRRITPDGIINAVAGNGMAGYDGDGVAATEARLYNPTGVAVTPNGVLYISDSMNARIRSVGHDGIITTLAGTGTTGWSGDGGPAARAQLRYVMGIAAGPDGSVYVADNGNHRIRRIEAPMAASAGGELLVPSEDGREVYAFDGAGRHLRTNDGLTGALRYTFGYTDAGQLATITDVFGNQTQITRDAAGKPVAILAPGLQRTDLTVGTNGYLSAITNPAREAIKLTYQGEGLLKSYTSPEGGVWRFTFDEKGRLTRDEDPAGGYKELVRTDAANGFSVAVTTAGGLVTTYRTESLPDGRTRRTQKDPAGAETVLVLNTDGTRTVTYPNGVVATVEEGPDPRWGMLVPIPVKITVTSPDGVTTTYTRERTAELENPTNPLSIRTMTEKVTTLSGELTVTYDHATHRVVTKTAEGRESEVVLNGNGLILEETDDLAAHVAPAVYVYDERGRLQSLSRGDQVYTYTYDQRHRLITRTDAAGNVTEYGYDDADRLIWTELPGTGVVRFQYDDDGNPTHVYLPSGDVHTISYSKTGLATGYTPPGSTTFTYGFNKDKARTTYTLPGDRSQTLDYDTVGRLTGITFDEAELDFTYTDETERVSTITRTPAQGTGSQAIAYGYDGDLVTSIAYTGPANGQYTYRYGNGFMLSSIKLDNGPELAISRDRDGLITGYGPFTITRGGPEGAPSQITDGTLTIDYSYLTGVVDDQTPTWPAGSALTVTKATPLTLTLSWTAAADNVNVTGYRLYKGDELEATLPSNTRTHIVPGLKEDTPYSFRVEAVDLAGNWTTDGPTLNARTAVDEAPVWPAGSEVTASAVTADSITLTWPDAEDDIAVEGYRVYQGDTELDTDAADFHTLKVTKLDGDTEYTFRAEARDRKYQWSAGLSATYRTLVDQLPTWPTGATLTASNQAPTSLTLTWTAAADDLAVTRYVIRLGGVVRTEVPGAWTTANVVGLAANGHYEFQVEACDRTGRCVAGPSTTADTPEAYGLDGELRTLRASRATDGTEANAYSHLVAVSADGSKIVFTSNATNLVADDTNNNCGYNSAQPCQDVFVLDQSNNGTISRVSLKPKATPDEVPKQRAQPSGIHGIEITPNGRYVFYTLHSPDYGNGVYTSTGLAVYDMLSGNTVEMLTNVNVHSPSVSGDGRFVLYERSNSTIWFWELYDRDQDEDGIFDEPDGTQIVSLPQGADDARLSRDGNWIVFYRTGDVDQIYAYHWSTGTETVVSTTANGTPGLTDSYEPDVSANGRFVVFHATDKNITGVNDDRLVIHDRDADNDGIFDEAGAVSNHMVNNPIGDFSSAWPESWRISADGRYVVFASEDQHLVEPVTNGYLHVFIHDSVTGKTQLLSRSTTGQEGDWDTVDGVVPDLSDDGATVVYTSKAGNLVPSDTNSVYDIFYTEWVPPVAPTWPAGSALTESNITPNGLTLTWTRAVDNTAVTAYAVYQDAMKIGTVGADVLTLNVTGLSPSTTYRFEVQAGDTGGNWSGDGPTVTVTTAPDVTPPALRQAAVISNQLVLTYNESLDPMALPLPEDFVLQVDGTVVENGISQVQVTADKVSITLAAPVTGSAVVVLSYTPGLEPVRDLYRNQAPALNGQAVFNQTADAEAPNLKSIAKNAWTLTLNYDEALDATSVPAAADFNVTGRSEVSIQFVVGSVTAAGNTVVLELEPNDEYWSSMYVSYRPGANPIRDRVGNAATAFPDTRVGRPETLTAAALPTKNAPTLGAAAPATTSAPVLASGQFASRVHTVNSQGVYALNLTWDELGRITARTETVAGVTHTYDYTYDANGQLLTVAKDGTVVEAYTYDVNGNRKTQQTYGGAQVSASYDTQDRITALGAVAYTFDAAGFLTRRGNDTFVYSTRGELLSATLGGGATITYGYDGFGRRVSRTDANGTHQYLYGNPGNPFQVTDVRDPAGKLTTYFYDDAGILYAMQRDGVWYYIAADQVGTPRVITDADGLVVKTMEFDSFGVQLSDSAPGFDLPFGYAGGLVDQATGLVRFGFRDYDPAAGRWTARDPLLFKGGQVNLYVYVGNNPISLADPTGLFCIGGSAYAGVGGGIKVCFDEDGMGVCGEVGFGVGAGVEVEPMGAPEDGSKIKAEAKCQLGPLGGGVGGSFDECGVKLESKLCGGPVCVKASSDGDVTMQADSYDFGVGCDGKIAGEVCGKW